MAVFISKEEHIQACRADLAAWLLAHHGSDVRLKYGSVVLASDDHVSVKHGYTGYTNFRSGETGNNIDYLMRYLGYTYPNAVRALLGADAGHYREMDPAVRGTDPPKSDFRIPGKANHCRNVFAFLMSRGIPAETIRMLIDKGLLYQSDPYNNAVFITPERDYYEQRGTSTYADRRCKNRDTCDGYKAGEHGWCSQEAGCGIYKPDPFHGCNGLKPNRFWYLAGTSGKTERVYICESAIDAVSLYVIHERSNNGTPAVYVGIGGAAKQGAIDRIKRFRKDVVIATDNDPAGDECRFRNRELPTIRPVGKDWNDDLNLH